MISARIVFECIRILLFFSDRATLLPIIKEWIADGTTIVSDFWRAYDCLNDEGYVDLKVNHSLHFKDPVTENKSVSLSTEVLCDVFVLLNRAKLIRLSRVNRQFFYAIKQNLSSSCLLIKRLFEQTYFLCSKQCPGHYWYMCNSFKLRVPALAMKYVRFERTTITPWGEKSSYLHFLNRLKSLKHLWEGYTFEISLKHRIDLDFYNKMLQIVVSPTSGPARLVMNKSKTRKLGSPLPFYPILAVCQEIRLSGISCEPTEIVQYLHAAGPRSFHAILECWSEDEARLVRNLIQEKFEAATSAHPFMLEIKQIENTENKVFEKLENLQTQECLLTCRWTTLLRIQRKSMDVCESWHVKFLDA